MKISAILGALFAGCALSLVLAAPLAAQSTAQSIGAQYLPPDIPLVVSFSNLGSRWDQLADSPLVKQILELPQVRQGMEGKKYREFQLGVTFVESIFGQKIPELLQDLTERGATLAWKSEREFVVLFQPTPEVFERLKQTLKEFATAAALGGGDKAGPQLFTATYRGIEAFGIDKARMGFAKGWVVLTSSSDLGKGVINRILGDRERSLAEQDWYQQAAKITGPLKSAAGPTASAALNWSELRKGAKFEPRGVDPARELFLGGILDTLESAPVLALAAELTDGGASVQVAAPLPERAGERLDYFFGSGRGESAPPPLDLPNRIFSARWHRDIGLFWKMAPQLIQDENALAGIAKAESDISTLLGGMVTVSDLFGYLGPDLELVAVPVPAAVAELKPTVQIPAVAIAGELRDPAKAQQAIRLAFQQVVSFANTNAGAGRYPPLEVLSEREAGTTLVTVSYVNMGQEMMSDGAAADLYKNFAPTLGFRGDRFVLASHRDLATQVLDCQPKANATSATGGIDNTVVELWPAELAAAGAINREPLIAQRMLSSGQDRAAAAADVDAALNLLKHFRSTEVRLHSQGDLLVLAFDARLSGTLARSPE
jgi:hypothetical protein